MYLLLKRLIDVTLSIIALLLLLPLFLIVILLLLLTGEHEVFYFQKRIGLKNRKFHIWKFATMVKDSMNIGSGSITLRDDPRVTVVGKILRMTKMNELPQIINVIKGDMSLVGPRPLVDRTFLAYSKKVQATVYNSKPGITGIGSIVFRDEERMISDSNLEPHVFYREVVAPHKGELEMWYQENKSTWTDLKLIFLTAWMIPFRKSELYKKILKGLPKQISSKN